MPWWSKPPPLERTLTLGELYAAAEAKVNQAGIGDSLTLTIAMDKTQVLQALRHIYPDHKGLANEGTKVSQLYVSVYKDGVLQVTLQLPSEMVK